MVMSGFSTREQSEAVIVVFDNAAGLNDFRNQTLRDELYDLVQSRAEPRWRLIYSRLITSRAPASPFSWA